MDDEPGPQRPYLEQRYRLFVLGRAPGGYDAWTRRQMGFARWVAIQMAIEACIWALAVAAIRITSGGWEDARWTIVLAIAAVVVLAPIRAAYRRRRILQELDAGAAGVYAAPGDR